MITKISVEDPVHKDVFEVIVVHMHGDADNYTTDSTFFDYDGVSVDAKRYDDEYRADIPQLLEFINFMLACKVAFPCSMGGDDGFWKVSGYDKYQDFIHLDNECCDGHATPQSVEVFFYDENGAKCSCTLS